MSDRSAVFKCIHAQCFVAMSSFPSLSSSSVSTSMSSASTLLAASSSSSSASPASHLSLLPSALIPLVCVFLTPSEKSSLWSRLCRSHRSQLTSQCFQQDHLHLTPAVLDSLIHSPYLANLLSHILSLTIRLSFADAPQAANFSQNLLQFFNPLPPQPEPNPATNPPQPPPPFPFPHLTHLSLHEDSDTNVIPTILSHPAFPASLRQLHVLYRSYQHPLPPFLASSFPELRELSIPATLSTSNMRAILRLPSLRVLDLSAASVVAGVGAGGGMDDDDEMGGGWVSAVRAVGGVGQQLEVLLFPRGGGQMDDVLKLIQSQVKPEPVEPTQTEEEKKAEVTEQSKTEVVENEKVLDEKKQLAEEQVKECDEKQITHMEVLTLLKKEREEWTKHAWSLMFPPQPANIQPPTTTDDEKKEEVKAVDVSDVKSSESSADAVDTEGGVFWELASAAAAAAEAEEEAADAVPDAPDFGALFFDAAGMRVPDPFGRYAKLEELQKAEEAVALQLKNASTPPTSATGRRKKPTFLPSNIRYLSVSGVLSMPGIYSLARLPHLHSLLFDFYQMSSRDDVFEAFVECTQNQFTQLRLLRLCDWSDEQVMGGANLRRTTKERVTGRIQLMLTRLQRLEYLDMRFPPQCDVPACMPALYQMCNLRKLWLIDSQSVRGLYNDDDPLDGQWRDEWTVGVEAAFPHLIELNLSSLSVDEESMLSIIANAPKLLDVSILYSAEVTLAMVYALSRHCQELRLLDIDGCSNVALTAEGWELGHEKYSRWLAKQPNLLSTSSTAQSSSLFSLSSSVPSSSSVSSCSPAPLPFVSTIVNFPALSFLYLTLSYDTDSDFVNLDTAGFTRFVDTLSSSPLTHANISSEHLTSKHVALLERWSQLSSLNIATTGYGSQPRMAKTLLEYDGKVVEEDAEQEEDDEDGEGEENTETDDEKEDEDQKMAEARKTEESGKGEKEEKVYDEETDPAIGKTGKKIRKLKIGQDKVAVNSEKRAMDDPFNVEEKKESSATTRNNPTSTLSTTTLSSPSSSSLLASPSNEPELVDTLQIYTRPSKRTPLQQSAYDRSITTQPQLQTRPRSLLDLHMLRYEGSEGGGDEQGTLVFSRCFRTDVVHDGMAGREAYFTALREHLGRDRKRGESELWSVRGRGRGRRRRALRGGFRGFGGR